MVLMELNATEKRNKAPQKETHKCYNYGKISDLAKICRSKKQANATQSKKQKDRRKRDPRKKRQLNAIKTKTKSDHATLSLTTCYNNDCYIHLSKKQGSRWFSKQPRGKQLHAIGREKGYDIPSTEPFLQQIEML